MSNWIIGGRTTASKLSVTSVLFLFMAPVVVILYASFVFNPANRSHTGVYLMQVIADTIGMISLLSLWITVLTDIIVPHHHRAQTASSNWFVTDKPTVDIMIPVAGEDLDIVTATIQAALAMDYPHQIWILDDGGSDELKAQCIKLGVNYIRRKEHTFAKAGNLNNGLKYAHGDFFAIFDADQVPRKNFLTQTLSYFENPRLAMVQSPQVYGNKRNFIASGTAQAQEIFYKYVLPAKNISNSAFCVGTNVLFRRKAINNIGGMAQVGHSEDVWTSYKLHQDGWQTIFINEVLAIGRAPETIVSFFRQQLRWAKRGLGMLFFERPAFNRKLTLDQRLQYLMANIFYLVGITVIMYLLIPIFYLLFNVSPIKPQSGLSWAIHYIPYLTMYYSLSILLLGRVYLSTMSTSLASFYPYLMALFAVIFGTKYEWIATTASKRRKEPILKWIWPHITLILLTLTGLLIAWVNPTDVAQTVFASFWALANLYFIFAFLTHKDRIGTTQIETN